MELTPEQQQKVTQWVREGLALADVQRRLREEFEVNLTYMEVRFLVDDLNVEFPVTEEPEEEKPTPSDDLLAGKSSGETPAGVSVSLDKVVRPGSMISGSVTFSDGVSATWYVDSMGRLGLKADREGYQPSQEDVVEFQEALQNELRKAGFQ